MNYASTKRDRPNKCEAILRELETQTGFIIGWRNPGNTKHADAVVLISETKAKQEYH